MDDSGDDNDDKNGLILSFDYVRGSTHEKDIVLADFPSPRR